MFQVGGDVIFFAFAALVQIVIGLVMMVRPSEQKWRLPAGFLFLINGAISVASMLTSGSDDFHIAARNFTNLLDPVTSYLIAFMALMFPRPPKFLQGKEKWVAVAFCLVATAQFLTLFLQPEMYDKLYRFQKADGGGWVGAFYVAFIQEVAWTLVLVRWSRAVVQGVDWQFGLLALSLVVRACHMTIVAVGTRINNFDAAAADAYSGPYVYWQLCISFLPLIALVYAFVTCLMAQGGDNRAKQYFLVFLVIGVVEALFSMASLAGIPWEQSPFLFLDVLLLRPVFIWGSLYGLPRTTWGKWVGGVAFVLLSITAFVPSSRNALVQMQVDSAAAWFFACFFTFAMTALAVRFLFPLLKEEQWQERKSILQT